MTDAPQDTILELVRREGPKKWATLLDNTDVLRLHQARGSGHLVERDGRYFTVEQAAVYDVVTDAGPKTWEELTIVAASPTHRAELVEARDALLSSSVLLRVTARETCGRCGGYGFHVFDVIAGTQHEPCPACNGEGTVERSLIGRPCGTCGGVKTRPGCPEPVWDGPYKMRCGLGGDGTRCARHGLHGNHFEREFCPDCHRDTDGNPTGLKR